MTSTIVVPAEVPPSVFKRFAKCTLRGIALIIVSPVLLSYWLKAAFFNRNLALESRSQLLSLWPGMTGQYLRRAFLQRVIARCHSSVLVEFGSFFSQTGAMLDENVYIGPRCGLGLVHLQKDVLLAAIVQADVGKGTIVAAGAVVTKPLPDNVIAAGVPAKVIRSRFESTVPIGEH